jgi:hypothetical protein
MKIRKPAAVERDKDQGCRKDIEDFKMKKTLKVQMKTGERSPC